MSGRSRSPRPIVEIAVEDPAWDDPGAIGTLIEAAVAAAAAASGETLPEGAEISVLLTSDAAIRELNRDHRGKDKPTNVLSFPTAGPDEPLQPLLGDIVLARETLIREAEAEGKPFADHLRHLAVHGTLHLLGYDHETDAEAEEMEALETAILAELGVPDPYADPATPLGAAGAAMLD